MTKVSTKNGKPRAPDNKLLQFKRPKKNKNVPNQAKKKILWETALKLCNNCQCWRRKWWYQWLFSNRRRCEWRGWTDKNTRRRRSRRRKRKKGGCNWRLAVVEDDDKSWKEMRDEQWNHEWTLVESTRREQVRWKKNEDRREGEDKQRRNIK